MWTTLAGGLYVQINGATVGPLTGVTDISGKANLVHTHAQADVTNLVTDLAGKAPTSHTHSTAQITDYQENTWTPRIDGSTAAGAGTYSVQAGRYTRIGRLVFVEAQIAWSAHTGTGAMVIAGLPFPVLAGSLSAPGSIWASLLTFSGQLTIDFLAGFSVIRVASYATGGAWTALPIDTAATIAISGVYTAA
jgi:hypothetical protein